MTKSKICDAPEVSMRLWIVEFKNRKKETGCALVKARTTTELKGILRNDIQFFSDKDIVEFHEIPYEDFTEAGVLKEIKNDYKIY